MNNNQPIPANEPFAYIGKCRTCHGVFALCADDGKRLEYVADFVKEIIVDQFGYIERASMEEARMHQIGTCKCKPEYALCACDPEVKYCKVCQGFGVYQTKPTQKPLDKETAQKVMMSWWGVPHTAVMTNS